jgi:hypothetical protein
MEKRRSRVAWSGATSGGGGTANQETRKKLEDILNEFGIALEDEANSSKLDLFRFPIFKKFEIVTVITANKIIYIISPPEGGGFPLSVWSDFRQMPNALDEDEIRLWTMLSRGEDTLSVVHDLYGWERVWTLEFDSGILELQPHERAEVLQKVARDEVSKEKEEIDREEGLVKFKPIFRGRDFFIQNDLCFVLIPFHEPFSSIFKDHIKPTLTKQGLTVMRADDIFKSTPIIEDIWEYINKARLIVADVTGKNPNVFYELGIAHTLGKEVIILTQRKEDIPFDLQHLRYFAYADNLEGWKDLERKLVSAVREIIP